VPGVAYSKCLWGGLSVAIYMLTPNGRFATGTRLCLSMSDYHPETWNPVWTVSSVLIGLLSFMLDDEETIGSVKTTVAERRRLALASHGYNMKDKHFRQLFPKHLPPNPEVAKTHSEARATTSTPGPNPAERSPSAGWMESLFGLSVSFFVLGLVIWFVLSRLG